jgi:hypothetical protein
LTSLRDFHSATLPGMEDCLSDRCGPFGDTERERILSRCGEGGLSDRHSPGGDSDRLSLGRDGARASRISRRRRRSGSSLAWWRRSSPLTRRKRRAPLISRRRRRSLGSPVSQSKSVTICNKILKKIQNMFFEIFKIFKHLFFWTGVIGQSKIRPCIFTWCDMLFL